jgi:protein gp37
MAASSDIEWTDATWNPVRGCTKVSPGCKHCYAERFAERFRGVAGHPFEAGFDLRLIPAKLAEPLKWHLPKKIFVNSMSDLFHDDVPETYIGSVVDVMRRADWHVYQVLTKRAARLRDYVNTVVQDASTMPHIWWGVSVEDKRHGLPRIQELRATNAAVRFLSIEPLLEDLGDIDLSEISWVIVGGESGPRARRMDPSWVDRLFHQCREQDVPFFFKQWGGTRKKLAGRLLHGRTYDEMPRMDFEVPAR